MNNYITDIYKTLNILCVEDDKDVLEMYEALFSLIFNKVYFASNGIEGLECFQKNKDINIVLTDYMMPKCNGLEMTKEIRKRDSSVPIVMVTALESIEMLREAIDLNITSFLKKPFTSESLFLAFNTSVKSVIADRCLVKEQAQKIHYNTYQENLTFDKENLITKNDLAQKKKLFDFTCETFYKPKDILSGDSYLIKEINDDEYFLFIVDGMGKGISASVTAMLCSAFINYHIEKLKEKKEKFSLELLLKELLHYIQPNLLEYEVISANFFYFNKTEDQIQYAIFSMPPSLYMLNGSDEVYKIKSNNIPLAPYTSKFTIDSLKIQNIKKLLIYSDGLNESTLKCEENNLYNHYLKSDFKAADTIETFKKLYTERLFVQEDDITYIFLTKG